jgi:predicted metal-dependent peptidase
MSEIKNQQAFDRLCTAKSHLLIFNPFFGMVLSRMKIREVDWCPTMAVDGVHLFYNPDFTMKLKPVELEGVLTHEALHVIFSHPIRMAKILKNVPPPPKEEQWLYNFIPSPEHEKCLLAADYTVNPILIKGGKKLPGNPISIKELYAFFSGSIKTISDGYLYDISAENKTFEEVYGMLPNIPKQKDSGSGQGQQGGMQGQQNKGGAGGKGNKNQAPQGSTNPQDRGSLVQGAGGLLPHPGMGEVDANAALEQAAAEHKQMMTQIIEAVKSQGKIPAGLESLIENFNESKIYWEELLKRFLEVSSKDDYTWAIPNRRYLSNGNYLPSLNNKKLGTVVVSIDTSGSISNEMLTQFASEVCSILETTRPEKVIVVYCDAEVGSVDEFTVDDFPLKFHVTGRGGTSFVPPFEYVRKNDINPIAFVYLTDGYGDWPNEVPYYPVMWVIEPQGDKNFACPWGDTIWMEE